MLRTALNLYQLISFRLFFSHQELQLISRAVVQGLQKLLQALETQFKATAFNYVNGVLLLCD